jgi:2-polyprenyl-3-methyl-5-hydroxy-6-metoxy-1,4-benzoquinol methylase
MSGEEAADSDDWESHWKAYAEAARLNPAQRYRHALLISQLRALGARFGDRLLDIGSGQGDFLVLAARALPGLELAGFEMSREGVAIARARLPQARFHQADLFAPPAELSAYADWAGFAVCSEVLEHLDQPEEFLARARTYLQPGGNLLVTVPAGPLSAFDQHIGHRRHYTVATLAEMARAAGLEIVKISRAGFPFFNLYRLLVVMSGRRLVSHPAAGQGRPARLLSRLFGVLFAGNLSASPFGWQLLALLRRPDGFQASHG